MIITMKKSATKDIEHVMEASEGYGLQIHVRIGEKLQCLRRCWEIHHRLTRSALRRTSMWRVLFKYHPLYKKASLMFHPEDYG